MRFVFLEESPTRRTVRITRQTASELQLEDSGLGMVLFGTLAIVVAVVSAGFAINDGKLAAAVVVVGGFGSAGLLILRRATSAIHHFDLQRGILTIDTRPVLGTDEDDREAVTYPLHTLADVTLEGSSSTDGDGTRMHTYRPVYVFRDGTRRPLLPYFTTQVGAQSEIQAAIRSVLVKAGAKSALPRASA